MRVKISMQIYVLLMFCNSISIAQTVLSTVNLPVAGDLWSNKTISDTTIQPGIGGSGIVWNFSNYFVTPAVISEHFVTPTGTSNDLLFPSANLKVTSFFGMEDYYIKTSGYLQYVGSKSNAIELIFTNSNIQKVLSVPFAFGDSIVNQPVSGTGMQGYPVTGSISVKADGAGDLILYTGAFVNTLRVVTDINLVVAPGTGVDTYLRIKKHTWYSTLYRAPVFQISELFLDGPLGSSKQKHVTVSTLTTVVNDLTKEKNSFSIYPNPAIGKIMLGSKANSNSRVHFSISDLTGKIWKKNEIDLPAGDIFQLDISELPRGVYIVSVQSGILKQEERIIINY